MRGGCSLFDLEELRRKYSPEDFANLLMCQFIDDTASIFTLANLQRCMVDSWEIWADFEPLMLRPFGFRSVWLGDDPALTGDSAALVVVAPPIVPGGPLRVVEKHQFRGMDFEAQAARIKEITQRYNVAYMAIDTTGIGHTTRRTQSAPQRLLSVRVSLCRLSQASLYCISIPYRLNLLCVTALDRRATRGNLERKPDPARA